MDDLKPRERLYVDASAQAAYTHDAKTAETHRLAPFRYRWHHADGMSGPTVVYCDSATAFYRLLLRWNEVGGRRWGYYPA